jgi:hypothetical protein
VLEPEFIAIYYPIKKAFFQLEEYIAIFLLVFTHELFDYGIFNFIFGQFDNLMNNISLFEFHCILLEISMLLCLFYALVFSSMFQMGGAIYPDKVFTKYITNASNNI